MRPFDLVCVKLEQLNIDKPYCFVLGYKHETSFTPNLITFNSKESFDSYCDALLSIFEPHERPRMIFI